MTAETHCVAMQCMAMQCDAMHEDPMDKPYVSPFARAAKPREEPRKPSLPAPEESPPEADPTPTPKPKGVKSKRYNLTVRLSPDERDHLEMIGRTEGKPNPMSLAETVRWFIANWRR